MVAAPRHVLPIIVVAQFGGGSLWFVANAVLGDLQQLWPHVDGAVGLLTSGVQLGFIAGTLGYALLGVADRFAAHRVFCASALAGAVTNAAALAAPQEFALFLGSRVLTGVFLAGIYPVGMKLAASWFRDGLGAAIGMLVGALVLGTAFPHWLRSASLDPTALVLASCALAAMGGLAVLKWAPEGPGVTRARQASFRDAFAVFGDPGFRSAALGYFGHMWELYAFWAFVPFAVALVDPSATEAAIAQRSFIVIGVGALGCVAGGLVSRRTGSARVAFVLLCASGACCLVSPWVLGQTSPTLGLGFLVLWGVVVVGDSPQFSAIAARCAPRDRVGTSLTTMNAVGFAITIPAIQLLSTLQGRLPGRWVLLALAPGPVLGLMGLYRVARHDPTVVRTWTRGD